jgi:hypothetical protein
MNNNLQKVIDDTVVLYNGVYSKTYKSIVRSRDYKRYLSHLNDTEAVVSQTVLKKIAVRKPYEQSIKLKQVPSAADIELLKQDLV